MSDAARYAAAVRAWTCIWSDAGGETGSSPASPTTHDTAASMASWACASDGVVEEVNVPSRLSEPGVRVSLVRVGIFCPTSASVGAHASATAHPFGAPGCPVRALTL